MKIVVIGKFGQLAKALQKQRAVSAYSSQELNLLDVKSLRDLDFDVLINAAAYNWTEKAESEPHLAFHLNGHAVGELALIAQEKNARFVHVSSDFVFSGIKGSPYTENDKVAPLSVYGASKALGEHLALQYANSYVFRTASLFSQEGHNFPNIIIKRANEGKELKVINDIVMSPTNAFDLASIIFKAIDQKIPFGLYNAVNRGQASWYEFAQKILDEKQINHPIAPCSHQEFPSKIKRPLFSALDVSKLENAIGRIPSWEESLSY